VDTKRSRYEFESSLPTWRVDIAVADYRVVERPERGIRAYVFPKDLGAANAAMDVIARSIEAFTQWLGPALGAGYTLIEVPEGYGSQAGAGYFVQTADALRSQDEMRDLAHEIAHAWNVPSREENISRFLDEAFATYFQALVDDVLLAPGAKQRRLEKYRQRYLREVEAHPQWGGVAIADYGRADLTDLSYTKGPWVLAVLDEVVGHDAFLKTVRTFLGRYRESGATLPEFKAVAEEIGGRRLDRLWSQWIEQGEASTALLRQHSEPGRIAEMYR
jgi:aminopeptidase N